MKKTVVLSLLLASGVSMASSLYTDTYMSQSGIVKPTYSTGIPNLVSINTLMHKKTVAHASLYFKNGVLTEASTQALKVLLKQSSPSAYVSVIGHTSGYLLSSENVQLNAWSTFWQHIGSSTTSINAVADSVNQRILVIYKKLKANRINSKRIYTENRMDRDPISTEATELGRTLNARVDVVVYR